ncbi:hypothetical protein ACSTI0_00430 [Vibrio parahaemolyticus]
MSLLKIYHNMLREWSEI